MRRLLFVLSVVLVMAAMVAAMAVPAFASKGGGDGPNFTASVTAGCAYGYGFSHQGKSTQTCAPH